MLDAAKAILRNLPHDRRHFDNDEVLQTAFVRWVEVIGEAANHVRLDVQRAHPEIPWRKIIGMRNHVTHGYYDVDHNTLWNVLAIEVPKLVPLIQAVLDDLDATTS